MQLTSRAEIVQLSHLEPVKQALILYFQKKGIDYESLPTGRQHYLILKKLHFQEFTHKFDPSLMDQLYEMAGY